MKKAGMLMAALWLCVMCMAQSQSWKQFNEFHSLVREILHPVMTGNVKPVKDSSEVLVAKAKAWQASPVPADVNADVFKEHVAELIAKCTTLNNAVKAKKPKSQLKTMANNVHESFHDLLSACKLKD